MIRRPMPLLALALTAPAAADEGMWLPEQLPAVAANYPDLGVPAEVLADPTGPVLGSVVSLGGCTGSFVSPDGLIATNHHCVEGYLQALSDPENNRWRDGFVAGSREAEGSTGAAGRVYITIAMEDVTDAMLAGITARTRDADRADRLEANDKALVAACEARAADRRCRVAGLDGGVRFLLVETRELRDLRVVWAPPRSVGQFGGDIDNWEWPRHGFDAALLRVYVAPDGSSAPYSADNVPFRNPHHLDIGPGLSEGDLAMVAGYPGRTTRHRLARELAYDVSENWQRIVDLVDRWMPILETHAAASDDASARLGPLMSSLANVRKNRVGVLEGLARSGGLSVAEAREQAVLDWVKADRKRARTAMKTYDTLATTLDTLRADDDAQRLVGRLMWASSMLSTAHRGVRWAAERAKPDAERDSGYQDRDREPTERSFDRLDRSLYLPSERALVTDVLTEYAAAPPAQRMPSLDRWLAGFAGVDAAVASLYDTAPALADAAARKALLDTSAADLASSTDPFLQLAHALEADLAPRRDARDALEAGLQKQRAAWAEVEIAYAAGTDTLRSPDANSTLRVTLGRVQGYAKEDGLVALPFTTLAGFAAKAGPEPFDAPAALVEAARKGPTSPWAVESLGDVPVDLLADLDTTGGNSGSPVLDAQGRFVGLLFDGVWESVANDHVYDAATNRSIVCDVRGLGWLLDQTPDARWIAAEMGLTR